MEKLAELIEEYLRTLSEKEKKAYEFGDVISNRKIQWIHKMEKK